MPSALTSPLGSLSAWRPEVPTDACLRLGWLRLSLVALEGILLVLSLLPGFLLLPWGPMLGVLALQGSLALAMIWQAHQGRITRAGEAFLHLLADGGTIATLVYFSGGYANPFISLLLVPLLLSATLFGPTLIWVMTGAVALAYTLLMRYYLPLRLELTGAQAVDLHLTGMWLNFLITASLIALFVARLTAAVRARDLALAEARERALRDERLFALGTQAAAAAHDLATPLATLGMSLEELRQAYEGDDELAPPLATMGTQVARMRQVLAALRAAAQPAGDGAGRPADAWLSELLRHWRELRPGPEVTPRLEGPDDAPTLRDEPLLNAALVTLLNNAADAGSEPIDLRLAWGRDGLDIEVLDRGPGLNSEGVSKPDGWGVGLLLAQAAMEHLGGSLDLLPRPGGGLLARLRLPLPEAATA